MNGIIQNQNRNKFLIYKKFEIKIKTEMQKAVLFKTETETNIRSYLVTTRGNEPGLRPGKSHEVSAFSLFLVITSVFSKDIFSIESKTNF